MRDIGSNMAPGCDGFSISLYKKFWHLMAGQIFGFLDDFAKGRIEIEHLNSIVRILLPKVPDEEFIC